MSSDNVLSRIDEGLADVRRMLARVHADPQTVKHDVAEFRELGLIRTIQRTSEPISSASQRRSPGD